MKLFTYQSKEAYEKLQKEGELKITSLLDCKTYMKHEPNDKFNINPFRFPYALIRYLMKQNLKVQTEETVFPIWAWKKWEKHERPNRKLNKLNKGMVLIYFEIPDEEVFLSDFDIYENILCGGLNFIYEDEAEREAAIKPSKTDEEIFEDCKKFFTPEILAKATSIQATFYKLRLDQVKKVKFVK